MSLATLRRVTAPSLPELVDSLASRTGAWILVERFGAVVCHGTGRDDCPTALAAALVSKSTAPLRSAVVWSRSSGLVRGTLGELPVLATELGDGATAWFLGCDVASTQAALPLLVECLEDTSEPVHDAVVEELLHPRGPARRGAAPAALLVVLRSELPAKRLARAVLAGLADVPARVHVEAEQVVVGLPPEADASVLLARLSKDVPSVRAGACVVDEDASDWVTAARLAAGSLQAAVALGLGLGDPSDPAVAAELVLQEAQAAVGDLGRLLPDAPLQRLLDHDTKASGELVASLTAWCRSGFDVPAAAADLHVHVNTLRYRLKRAGEVSGLDLGRPRQLLALQLLLAV